MKSSSGRAGGRRGVRSKALPRAASKPGRAGKLAPAGDIYLSRALLDATADRALVVDPSGLVLKANERLARSLGMPMAKMIGRGIFDLFPGRLVPSRRAHLRRAVRTGQPVHHTDTREGRLLEHLLYPVRGSAGRVECVAIYTRDITRENANELALKASEEKYRQLVENSNLSVFTVRRDGVFLFLNRRAAEYLGGRAADFVGKRMDQLFPPEIARRQMSVVRQVIRRRRGVVHESLNSMKGEMRWFEMNIQPLRDADGKVRSALATAADITDRKLSEEALRLSEQRLKMIMQCSRDGISITEMDLSTGRWRLILANDAYVKMSGRSRKVLMACSDLAPLV